jgi:hypothetical protein
VWLLSDERRPEYHAETFATLQALNLKVGRAWAIKEALRTLWTYRQPAAVKRFFTRWYGWAVRSRLEPVKQVAATLKRHLGLQRNVIRLVERGLLTNADVRRRIRRPIYVKPRTTHAPSSQRGASR